MIWPSVYRHVTGDSLAALEICERAAFPTPAASATFYKFGRLLLRDEYVRGQMNLRDTRRIDALTRFVTGRRPVFWKATRLLAETRQAESRASVIFLKNNIRAFYPAEAVTLKVSNPNEPVAALRIANEAAIRGRVRQLVDISVPRILLSGEAASHAYLLEDVLDGYQPLQKSGPALAAALVAFQRANRVAPSAAIHPELVADAARQCAADLGIAVPEPLLKAVQSTMAPAPWSLCNGDLSRTNIFVRDGHFTIIDWEFGLEAPAAIDAVRLATQFTDFADDYIRASGEPDARRWLMLGCLQAMAHHHARWKDLAANSDTLAIRRKTQKKLREIIALADSLDA